MAVTAPKQARARETYERLLAMGQQVLSESGIEGLSSNVVVERLGLTPPAFYRYFPNKYELLRELGNRLMAAQNAVLIESDHKRPATHEQFVEQTFELLSETLEATRSFVGGYALLVSMRALPEIRAVRLDSHEQMAALMAKRLVGGASSGTRAAKGGAQIANTRLAVEVGYSAIEMLFETNFKNEETVLRGAARGIAAILNAKHT